jgi:glycosyltransferase involved in cell wall biosynthesis
MPGSSEGLVFTMIAPGDPAKGLAEFVEAARRTKVRVPKTRFVLAVDEMPYAAGRPGFVLDNVPAEIEVAAADDVAGLLAATHVFVLPSHAEGFAQRVAEALACGRPAITSDIAGCREIVDERVSGVLAPPRDAVALGQAIDSFLRRPEDIAWMGQAARRKAERRFDVRAVNAELLDIMDLAGEAAQ